MAYSNSIKIYHLSIFQYLSTINECFRNEFIMTNLPVGATAVLNNFSFINWKYTNVSPEFEHLIISERLTVFWLERIYYHRLNADSNL